MKKKYMKIFGLNVADKYASTFVTGQNHGWPLLCAVQEKLLSWKFSPMPRITKVLYTLGNKKRFERKVIMAVSLAIFFHRWFKESCDWKVVIAGPQREVRPKSYLNFAKQNKAVACGWCTARFIEIVPRSRPPLKMGCPPLEFINMLAFKRGSGLHLEFIKMQPLKRGSASRIHQPKGVYF